MAKITIGLGFLRTPEQETELHKVAAALPDEWTIEMSGGPAGWQSPGIWDVVVKKTGGAEIIRKSFGPGGVDVAIRFLQALKPKQP